MIGNLKLDEFGIYFSEQPSYFQEGIVQMEICYNSCHTEPGNTFRFLNWDDNEVIYQIFKDNHKMIYHITLMQHVDLIDKFDQNNEFKKLVNWLRK